MTTPAELRRLAVAALIQRLSLDTRPIMVGCWRSEVGFEGLYWLPFLRHLAAKVPGFWERAVVVSRGGGVVLYGSWVDRYPDTTPEAGFAKPEPTWTLPRSVDLYSLRTVTECRRQNLFDWSKTKLQKQTTFTTWDRGILTEAAAKAGISGRYHTVHPSWMYWALAPFWDEDRGLKYLFSLADYTLLPKPIPPVTIEGLPAQYVAVKFYGRATWPHPHEETTAAVGHMVSTIAQQVPVLLLNSGHAGDEHTEMAVSGSNIFRMPACPPEQNLGVQLALLGRAQAFVGTYGGVAQVALRMGVPSLSVYTQFGGTAHAHLSLSSYLSKRTNVPFVVGSLQDAGLWKQVLTVVQQSEKPSTVASAVPA